MSRTAGLQSDEEGNLILLLDRHDVRWACGFTGSASRLVVDPGACTGWCIVDGRYVDRAESELAEHASEYDSRIEVLPLRDGETLDDALVRVVGDRVVSVDPRHVTVAMFQALAARLSLRAAASNVEELRRIKSEKEVALMARAADIASDALESVVTDGLCGRTEAAIRDRLDGEMRRLGADDVSFPTIVAAGANGARPHHAPGDKVVLAGEAVIIDVGAEVRGYRSDMTRTIFIGEVAPELEVMFDTVRRAQAAASAAVRAGVAGREVDRAARSLFHGEGLGHEYLHSTGHGVGLAIHENPILGPACTVELQAGEVVTAEPGLYRRGVGGVRIEDLLVVADGPARLLTLSPKDLTCPPSPRTI